MGRETEKTNRAVRWDDLSRGGRNAEGTRVTGGASGFPFERDRPCPNPIERSRAIHYTGRVKEDPALQEKLEDILTPSTTAKSFRITIEFGYKMSRDYEKAVDLAKRNPTYHVEGEGEWIRHSAVFTKDDVEDLFALFFARPRLGHDRGSDQPQAPALRAPALAAPDVVLPHQVKKIRARTVPGLHFSSSSVAEKWRRCFGCSTIRIPLTRSRFP